MRTYNPIYQMDYEYAPFESQAITPRLSEVIAFLDPNIDCSKESDLLDAGKRLVFGDALKAINNEYQDAFVLAMMYKYWMSCIGQETWQLFKFYLAGDVRAKAPAINIMFGELDRQYYESYEVVTRAGTSGNTLKISDNKVASDTTQDNLIDHNVSNQTTKSDATISGTQTDKKSGEDSETTHDTSSGTSNTKANATSSEDTSTTREAKFTETSKEITDMSHTQDDTTNETGSGTTDNTGTVTQAGTKTSTENGTKTGTNGDIIKESDTPQNGLDGLMDNTYMSSARITDGNTSETNKIDTNESADDTRTDNLHETSATTRQATSNSNKHDAGSVDRTVAGDQSESGNGVVNSQADSTTDVTTGDTRDGNKTGTRSETGESNKSETENRSGSVNEDGTRTSDRDISHNATESGTRDEDGTSTHDETETRYRIDYNRITSKPFIEVITDMFRDNFLLIH